MSAAGRLFPSLVSCDVDILWSIQQNLTGARAWWQEDDRQDPQFLYGSEWAADSSMQFAEAAAKLYTDEDHWQHAQAQGKCLYGAG